MQNKNDTSLFFRIRINLLNNVVWIEKVTISLLLVYGSRFHDTVLIMLCLEAFFRQMAEAAIIRQAALVVYQPAWE